jgi:alginate O-acetyltransferase complex protein AlgI
MAKTPPRCYVQVTQKLRLGRSLLFYEPLFLFLFFPIVFGAYLAVQRRATWRVMVLLVASVFFYFWSQPLFVPVVLVTCVTDFLAGRLIARGSRVALTAGIAINLATLIWYKYAGFAASNLEAVFGPVIPLIQVALPIGVSFIVFEKISYLVDIHRGRSRPAPDFQTYLLFVFLFPKLLAGPIMKYHELEAQLLAHGGNQAGDFVEGFRRFMLGVVKKTILADTLASGADMTFSADAQMLGFADAWWGVLFFAFQIYIDFSAYTDMAIGLARIFGFRLNENFNKPYISASITEFWRRWHMSLTTWIREYLYIPLGGNRVPVWRTYLNLWICFLLSGLWHGAAWTFIAWGAYNGLFLVLERLFLLRTLARMPALLANGWTFLITLIGWTLFRATSLPQAGAFFRAMAQPGLAGHDDSIVRTAPMLTAAAAAACISFLPRVRGFDAACARLMAVPAGRFAVNLILLLLFIFALAKALADPFKPFLYFRF